MSDFEEIEKVALKMLLAGENPLLEVLRDQLTAASVVKRDYTGVGFFTEIHVPANIKRPEDVGRLIFSDVHGVVKGLEHGVGFVLFLKNGAIHTLECFNHAYESFPQGAQLLRAYYVCPGGSAGKLTLLRESEMRDLEWVFRDRIPVNKKH